MVRHGSAAVLVHIQFERVSADFGEHFRTADVAFASLPRSVAGLLGRVGFFDRFVVTFNQPRNQIILRSVV